MPETLLDYLSFPFVRHALVVGVFVALAAGLLGVQLVLRRLSNMGDGLSHVAFASIAIGGVLNLSGSFLPGLIGTGVSSLVLLAVRRKTTKGDAALAMLSAGMLGLGYLVVNLFPASGNVSGDVCTTLFGSTSILTLSVRDVSVSLTLSAAVIAFCVLTHHRGLEFAFDEEYARVEGGRVALYNGVLAVIIAVVIVVAIRLVGALLVSALLVFPASAALRLFRSYRAVTIFTALFAAIAALIGILVSIVYGTPVGATVIAVDVVGFVLAMVVGKKG